MGKKKPAAKKKSEWGVEESVWKFYCSQVEVLLAQYENINQLLGKTNDWSHPGAHCEILIRELIRRNLPAGYAVNKGYVYGLVKIEGELTHCPEIDILVHDTNKSRPLFQMDDFVIVEPESVVGIIQVKRSFKRYLRSCPLVAGIGQTVASIRHLRELKVQERIREGRKRENVSPINLLGRDVFTAVLSFEGTKLPELKESLARQFDECLRWNTLRRENDPVLETIETMPVIVGALDGSCAITASNRSDYLEYRMYPVGALSQSTLIQCLLYRILMSIRGPVGGVPDRFMVPEGVGFETLRVPLMR